MVTDSLLFTWEELEQQQGGVQSREQQGGDQVQQAQEGDESGETAIATLLPETSDKNQVQLTLEYTRCRTPYLRSIIYLSLILEQNQCD